MQKSLRAFTRFEAEGFAIFKRVVADSQIELLTQNVEKLRADQSAPGLRNLLSQCPTIKTFATTGAAFAIAQNLLGTKPHPVRAILFDKTPESNWYVTWHQDVNIPVKNKINAEGFGPRSNKDGVVHVQPPASILEQMVSLRIHLDACAESNGAIKFIAGSHRAGILDAHRIAEIRDSNVPVICSAERGDIIAMRPLTLHSSSTATAPVHRRVLHLEYAGTALPHGMNWAEA